MVKQAMNEINEEKLSAILKANELIRLVGKKNAFLVAEHLEKTDTNSNFWRLVKQNTSK